VRLSELLGRQVDLLVREDLRPDLRQRIEADLVPVF
jgi:predicted nucleotidyltransferase